MPRSVIASVVIAALAATLLAGCGTMRESLEVVDGLLPTSEPTVTGVLVDPASLSATCPEEVMKRYTDNGAYAVNDISTITDETVKTVLASAGFDCVLSIMEGDELTARDVSAFVIDPTDARLAQVIAALQAAGFTPMENAWQLEDASLSAAFVARSSYTDEPKSFRIDDLGHDYSVCFFFVKA